MMQISPEIQLFIREHSSDDVRTLALQAKKYPDINMPTAITQIAGRKVAAEKIPSWWEIEKIWYPKHLSLEQCSSEITARYKARLLQGDSLTDLTGGFGIDCSFLATGFKSATYVERQEELCEIAAHNFPILNLNHINVRNEDGVAYLQTMSPVDCIFLDPARRNEHGGKTVSIADCEPNVAELEDLLLSKASRIMIKLSPMLDLSLALKELKHTQEVHILSVNNECKELLDKPADVVLMNGFEDDFVPKGSTFTGKRKRARSLMLNVANKLLGTNLGDDTLIVGTSGRYEFKNKGIDVFLESLNRLNRDKNLHKNVLAFINVPSWVGDPREDLQERLKSKEKFDTPLEVPFITHWLHNMTHDQVLDMLKYLGMGNRPGDKVKVIFVPCYLDGRDGIMNKEYYDILLGQDLSVYASYYEPWGYTPLESVAFHVPTITTDLAGFGLWVNSLKNQHGINDGVEVLHRSDYNYSEVADGIKDTITLFADKSEKEIKEIRKRAAEVAEQALWKHFIQYYYEAYDIALCNAMKRQLS